MSQTEIVIQHFSVSPFYQQMSKIDDVRDLLSLSESNSGSSRSASQTISFGSLSQESNFTETNNDNYDFYNDNNSKNDVIFDKEDPVECMICGPGSKCDVHLCNDCKGYRVIPTYGEHAMKIPKQHCVCKNKRLLYECSPGGTIWDGHAQCQCDNCFEYNHFNDDDDDNVDDNNKDPEN